MSDIIRAKLLFLRRYGGSDAGNAVERELIEHLAELQQNALPSNCSLCNGDGGANGSRCIRCGGWTQHKRLVASAERELQARAEKAEAERDRLRAVIEANDKSWGNALDKRDAWARRWKRAAKDYRVQRQVIEDILNTTIETTNAELKALRARLVEAQSALARYRSAERKYLVEAPHTEDYFWSDFKTRDEAEEYAAMMSHEEEREFPVVVWVRLPESEE